MKKKYCFHFIVLLAVFLSCNDDKEDMSAQIDKIQEQSLIGKWILIGYSNEGVFCDLEGRIKNEMYICFKEDGKMEGKICNELYGKYAITAGGGLAISDCYCTKMLSDDDEINFAEEQIVSGIKAFCITKGHLRLYFSDNGYIEFRP